MPREAGKGNSGKQERERREKNDAREAKRRGATVPQGKKKSFTRAKTTPMKHTKPDPWEKAKMGERAVSLEKTFAWLGSGKIHERTEAQEPGEKANHTGYYEAFFSLEGSVRIRAANARLFLHGSSPAGALDIFPSWCLAKNHASSPKRNSFPRHFWPGANMDAANLFTHARSLTTCKRIYRRQLHRRRSSLLRNRRSRVGQPPSAGHVFRAPERVLAAAETNSKALTKVFPLP